MALPPLLRGRLRVPVIASPLFIISNPALVIAQCTSGVVGSFPALNARPADELGPWIRRIQDALADWDARHPGQPAAPFAVNQIVHRSNTRLDHDLQVCCDHKVPLVITSLGARPEVNHAVQAYGGIIMHDVINDRFARKAIEKGADGLVAVAAGAGGHAGSLSPFALVAGSIATGGAILAAQAMGADLAYIGSAFIATEEAGAAAGHKQAIVEGSSASIVYTDAITGVHGNYLRPSLVAAGLDPANLPPSDPTRMNFGADKPRAWKDIWGSGQGIAAIDAVLPAAALVERLARDYLAARARLLAAPNPA